MVPEKTVGGGLRRGFVTPVGGWVSGFLSLGWGEFCHWGGVSEILYKDLGLGLGLGLGQYE